MAERKLRALSGLYEGDPDEPIFAGAVEEVVWECSDDEDWEKVLDRLKANAPAGTTDWREGWVYLDVPVEAFRPPEIKGRATPPEIPAADQQRGRD